MALAEQPAIGGKVGQPLGREPCIAAQASRHLIVGDEQIDRLLSALSDILGNT